MKLFVHISDFLAQANSSLNSLFEANKLETIDQLASNDRFLEHKVLRIEQYMSSSSAPVNERIDGMCAEYKEALAYIQLSSEF